VTRTVEPFFAGLTHRTASLYFMVVALVLFNLADAVLTLLQVHGGLATEANPLFGDLVSEGPVRFMAAKVALVSLGAWLLWRRRAHPWATLGICVSFMGYAALIAYHLQRV